METWYSIKCPNERRGHSAVPCGYTLKHVNGIQTDAFECIICPACGAQVFITFDMAGACTAYIPQKKKYLPSVKYPLLGKGTFTKTKERAA